MRVEVFSVIRTYSSSPSRRCAFSIGFVLPLRWSFRELERPAIGVDQAEFIGPSFPMMNDLRVSIRFHKCRYVLDRTPASNVPVLSLAEDPVQEPRSAQQPDVAAMQRRDRPARGNVVLWRQQ